MVHNTKVTYFYCNRSGRFTSKSKDIRSEKKQGSSKIGSYCTAGIHCEHLKDGKIKTEVVKTHYGHDCSLGHLRIPEQDRLAIASMLSQGVSFDNILNKIRDSVSKQIDRFHLTTKKDLHNVQRSFNIRQEQRHTVDAVSVKIWVDEMGQRKDNPVVFYKEQGKWEATVGINRGLDRDDFALVIQTNLQAEVLRQCGDNKVICVHATHGTNSYNFQLVSVLVIDEFGEGFPAGWCICNKEDHVLLSNFFAHLKEKTGPISPDWFMSDMAGQYYSSWVHAFGGNPRKLICTWHVDRAWRKNLSKIKDKAKQTEVYHMLRTLLDEMDPLKFEKLLDGTVEEWGRDSSLSDFLEYFQNYYVKNFQEWAGCHRKNACINTNMYAESFHRVLKYVYLKGKVNKRMDMCISVLLRISRDKAFDRILKFEKGKSTKRNSEVLNRHKVSLKLSTGLVTCVEKDQWNVKSSTKPDTTYFVQMLETCEKDCWIRCPKCCVCIHTYSCTCPDSLLRGVICKHIHLVIRYIGNVQKPSNAGHTTYGITDSLFRSVQNISRQGGVQDRLNLKLSKLAAGMNCTNDEDTLLSMEKHIDSCLSIINLFQNREPANKLITSQRNFYPTKRKRPAVKVRISKPSFTQKKQ